MKTIKYISALAVIVGIITAIIIVNLGENGEITFKSMVVGELITLSLTANAGFAVNCIDRKENENE